MVSVMLQNHQEQQGLPTANAIKPLAEIVADHPLQGTL